MTGKHKVNKPTPPTPTDAEVREARKRLALVATGEVAPSHHIRSTDIRTILTALDRAQELAAACTNHVSAARILGKLHGEIDALRAENVAQAEEIVRLREAILAIEKSGI